ncbi:MAG: ABC transporter transmembrane domain-containing protein, partial [Sandaracinobacteroides sp.]
MSPSYGQPAPDAVQGDADFRTLKRFLPYLWPEGRLDLKLRVAFALLLVLVAKATLLVMPFAYKGVIDRMAAGTPTGEDAVWVIVALVWAYAAGRFGAVLFDNLRNAVFERVGQEATRQLSLEVFAHIHRLSLRFHLERKTGSLARTIERGTKSVDNMLYLLLFNTFPVAIELAAVCYIFGTRLGGEYVAATMVMVVAYVWFTWKITSWRNTIRRQAVEYDTKAIGQAVDSLLNYETVKYFN